MARYVLIDIGGTSIKHGLLEYDEPIEVSSAIEGDSPIEGGLSKHAKSLKTLNSAFFINNDECKTEASYGAEHIMKKVEKIISHYVKLSHEEIGEKPRGICISTAGMVNPYMGSIAYSGPQIPGYKDTKIKDFFEEKFGIRTSVENDVNAAGLAEALTGAAKAYNKVLCLTIGTGIGGAFINNKQIYYGSNYAACEVGYMKLDGHNFQDLASTTALVDFVAREKKISSEELNGKIIFELAEKNDELCLLGIERMITYLALGISNICYILNPDCVVLGGGIMARKDLIAPLLVKKLDKMLIKDVHSELNISFASHGNKAGMLGVFYRHQLDLPDNR